MRSGDLPRISAFRSVVGWASDPDSFEILRGINDVRWALVEDAGDSEPEIVGMVGAVPLGEVGIMCHLAVRREYRGYGTGRRLAAWAVAYLRSRGVREVRLFATEQAEGVYRSLGFEPGPRRTVYRREAGEPHSTLHEGASDEYRVEVLRFADLPELFGVDHWSFGGERSHLILATLRLHPGLGLIARDKSGAIRGYLVRSNSRRSDASEEVTRIGPLMASDVEVAGLLLSRTLEPGRAFEAMTLGGTGTSDEAKRLFTEAGFSGRQGRRMMELGGTGEGPAGLRSFATTAYLAT